MPTPEELLAEAAALDEQGREAMEQGRVEDAAVAFAQSLFRRKVAEQMGLQPEYDSRIVRDVTSAQIQRRGDAIARSRAERSGNPIALAIAASKWRSITKYARHLRIAQPTLSRYLSGILDVPPEIADRVFADFGLGDDAWPRPPRR